MKLTARGQCAMRAMVELAMHGDKRLPVKVIAKRQDLSVRYLEQIMAALKKAGLVNSIKGPTGGYTLELQAESISMARIIFAVEGRNAFYQNSKRDALDMILDAHWAQVDQTIDQYLGQVSLMDIVKSLKEKSAQDYMYYI